MTWSAERSRGNEASKVRFDIVPYARGRLLDLGCGEDKVFPSALGVDNCKDNLLFGAKVKPDLVVETVERLDIFAGSSFDCVFSSHTLEHLEDTRAVLTEWWRLVKPRGYLVLYLPHRDLYPKIGEAGANPDHKHDFHPDDVIATMREIAAFDLVVNETRDQGDEYSFLQVYRKRVDGECTYPCNDPKPEKSIALVRLGAFGDALWLSSVLPHLKRQGYHVTVYTQDPGEIALRFDPHIDRFITMPEYLFTEINLVQFWLHEQRKYDRFVNFVGSVETRLLPTRGDWEFYWTDEVRRRVMNVNYLQTVHDWAGVEYEPRVRFYPTVEEHERATQRRAEMQGHVVVINPAGSGQYKWWPHWPRLATLLASRRIHAVVLGDVPGSPEVEKSAFIHVVGRDWPIRDALAFAQLADVVVGTESAIVNAVSFEAMLKIVLLSHSTIDNLTRDWPETISFAVEGLDCYPCHRIHHDMNFCTMDAATKASACQASIKPQTVFEQITQYLDWRDLHELTAEPEEAAA